MTITRFLLPGFMLAVSIGPAFAQFRNDPGGRYRELVPSVRPAGAEDPVIPSPPPMLPPARPPGGVTALEQMTVPNPQLPLGNGGGDPLGTLTGQPIQHAPLGSYPSPYYTDGPGCCGPLGRDGRVGYEVYSYAGVNMVFGDGLPDRVDAGWNIGMGIRTLFFDATHTAAWTVDFGGSYTYNRGQFTSDPVNLFLRSQPVQDQTTGNFNAQPDRFTLTAIRGVHRSSFNFSLGRDIWLLGDGSTGGMTGTNWRVGAWLGGRYGTSHVDLVPLNEVNGYSRRQNVFHGIVVGAHTTCDVPMGAWVWTNGLRVEYGHDWTNLVPPIQGNLHNVNIQWTTGIRY